MFLEFTPSFKHFSDFCTDMLSFIKIRRHNKHMWLCFTAKSKLRCTGCMCVSVCVHACVNILLKCLEKIIRFLGAKSGWESLDLKNTIISWHLLLDTAHFLPATHLRWEGAIMATKCTCAHRMFHGAHRHTHTLLKLFPGASTATLQIIAPMCVWGSMAV